jgi:hypothetical protein
MRYTPNVISYFTSQTSNAAETVFRQPTLGPELDIVNLYCEEHLAGLGANESLSIFLEPKLNTGFPDIVAVFWDQQVSNKWPQERSRLTSSDMAIVHHVNLVGQLPVDQLLKRFGARKTSEMMLRLSDSQVAEVKSDVIVRNPLNKIFAVKRIVAIEAKVRDWSKGLDQAFQNTLFASESYLLLESLPNSQNLFKNAEKLGVGILDKNRSVTKPYLKSKVGSLPTSHAAWLFNEWAWKFSNNLED